MKAAIYIRVSTNKEEQAQSLINQKQQAIQFFKDCNISLYDFYTDIESGTTDKREALKELINDAEDNQFNVIVTKELSRLARNGELSYKIKRIAENNGIHIITMDGVIDTTDPRKSGMYGLYAWIYEQESQRLATVLKQSIKQNTLQESIWEVYLHTDIL